ncbi:MAG: right-handed parallel beta-helix repeat-containing protein [Flavobacteriales bacterium]|nr:right-handed parallel beta-helix repeat-containing protein [Flavobacteriales bacterium]
MGVSWSLDTCRGQEEVLRQWQRMFIEAEDGDTVTLPAGRFHFPRSLSLDGKHGVVIRGAGPYATILSFKGQKDGAEGIKINHCSQMELRDFTVEDARGDGIKASFCREITFRNVITRWRGRPSKKNGAYGLYPVSCDGVLIEGCMAEGASDAGIYVGQSRRVVVRYCVARHNVAGIEIENCVDAEVVGCLVTENSGGILVFDLPELPVKEGSHIKVHHNHIVANNFRNFAPRGNIVGQVPPGTGVMVLSGRRVTVEYNLVAENKTASCAIVSFHISGRPYKDTLYNPYPREVFVAHNIFRRRLRMPAVNYQLGLLAFLKFGRRTPHILYDGIWPPDIPGPNPFQICIGPNENGTFVRLDAGNRFRGLTRDVTPYLCP